MMSMSSYLMSSILIIWVFHFDECSYLMSSILIIWVFLFNEFHFDNIRVPFWWVFLFDNIRVPFWWVFLFDNMSVPFWWVFLLIIWAFLFNEFHFDNMRVLGLGRLHCGIRIGGSQVGKHTSTQTSKQAAATDGGFLDGDVSGCRQSFWYERSHSMMSVPFW